MAESNGWEAVADRVEEFLRRGNPAEAWQAIDDAIGSGAVGEGEIAGPTQGFREVGNRIYWHHRSLSSFIAVQDEQELRLRTALSDRLDPSERAQRLRALGGVYYKLASFTWPGWDEPSIEIGPSDLLRGREAAQSALALREDPANAHVDFPYTMAMAHWAVGAHALVIGNWEAARRSFTREADCECEDGGNGALGRGYLTLTDLLENPRDEEAQGRFEDVLNELEDSSDADAEFYREQLLTARRVLLPR